MGTELCVLVHGFTGSPAELGPLAECLRKAGYEVALPVLAGHEGSREEMRRATAHAWIQSVRPIVEEGLRDGPVHLIGFSMGALISAIISAETPVQSLTMLAPALYYTGPNQMFRQIATFIKAAWNRGQLNSEYLRTRLDKLSQTPLGSVKQFRRLVQMAKPILPLVKVPVCIIQGEQDEIVEPRSAAHVYQSIGSTQKQVHYLPESGHMLCLDTEANVVEEIVLKFLKECS